MKKAICLLLVAAFIVSIVGCANDGSTSKRRTDFDIEYSADAMENFMNVVCNNVDGDAQVIEAIEGDYYHTQVEIKLAGKVSELSEMRFYNSDDSDIVSWAQVITYNPKSENVFNCDKELILAIERTLTGDTTAEQYITTLSDMENLAFSNDRDPVIVAEYELKDDLYAVIWLNTNLGSGWTMYYRLYITPLYRQWVVNSKEFR